MEIIKIIDIALVVILVYQVYKLVKGTVAINIFIGLAAIYAVWKIVSIFHLQLLSEILGQFIGFGVLILAIIFQQELRKLLILIGKGRVIKNKGIFKLVFSKKNENKLNIDSIVKACKHLSKNKTGAIIIITLIDDLAVFAESGIEIDSKISSSIIESIFYKNSPLHDGAIIIRNNKIISARCVLPVSNNDDFPENLGMRHRAAVGITEETDSIAIITSEETGKIAYVKEGELFNNRNIIQLEQFLNRIFYQER
tara:strand:+ start:2369 stop:3130 length:762 start_codon:yes stop_codon:yes gene_type:complete